MESEEIRHIRYNKISATGTRTVKNRAKQKWCVTEKVHGANFSIYLQPSGRMRCAKRTGFIGDRESFFQHHRIVERFRESIMALTQRVFIDYDCDMVVLFGELFGGAYPGYESDSLPVQQGVWYSPHLEFMLFDICINKHRGENFCYLPFEDTIRLGKEYGLFCSEPVFIGPLNEALSYDPKFVSTIPDRLGLPLISRQVNKAEGVVIRPYDIEQPFGSDSRGMTKIKVAEFCEAPEDPPPPTADMQHMMNWIMSLVNPNRISAAISKVGAPTDQTNWKDIVNAVLSDVEEECGIDELSSSPIGGGGASTCCSMKSLYLSVQSQIKYDIYNYLVSMSNAADESSV